MNQIKLKAVRRAYGPGVGFWILPVVWAVLLFVISMVSAQAKSYDYINISNPFLNKTPIAVSDFKPFSGHAPEVNGGLKAQQILREALDFTGYLKVIDPKAYLANPANTGIQLGQINFKDWTAIGADLLTTGGIEENNGQVTLQLRLFDSFNGKLLVGKIYTGPSSQIRRMIHMFCSEIAYKLTGNYGMFNSQIAFVSTVDGNKEIFSCEFDGHNPVQLTHHRNISLSPALSSDGEWLAYVSYAKGKPDIYIQNLKEKRGAIINNEGSNISPDWMPGKLNLVAALSFSGDQEIYLLTNRGEIIKRITKSGGIDVSPKFSPDGRKIAFVSNRGGTPQVYIQDLETADVKRITFTGRYNTSPAWSPDGKQIAYVGIEKNEIDIFVISLESGVPVQLTKNQKDNENPSWSPDGSLLVFTSTREGGVSRLFVMTAAGTDQRRLLTLNGKQSQPYWSKSTGSEN